MKNVVAYNGLKSTRKNRVNLEKYLFLTGVKTETLTEGSTSVNLDSITEHIKAYLIGEGEFRDVIRNSFGSKEKKGRLWRVIHHRVSQRDFLAKYSHQMGGMSIEELANFLVEKIAGLDALQELSEQDTVTDINCIGWDNIWVDDIHRGAYKTNVRFANETDFIELCHRFAFASGKNYSMAKPSVDAMFPQMRVNFVGQDLSPNISLSLRLISKKLRLNERYIIESGLANQEMIELLKATFVSESHLVCGATGTGKTELLRYFLQYSKNEMMIVIEDTPETYLNEIYPDKPIIMWKNREAQEVNKAFGYQYHIRNALRQNPTYLIIQESRGAEALDVLKAAETGHIVNTTLHAESGFRCIERFISMCQEAHQHPAEFYGKRIAKGFRIGIHIKRYGTVRKISQIVEYLDYEAGSPKVNVLFEYDSVMEEHVKIDEMSKELREQLTENRKKEKKAVNLREITVIEHESVTTVATGLKNSLKADLEQEANLIPTLSEEEVEK